MLKAKLAAPSPSAFLHPRPPAAAAVVTHLRHSTPVHRRLTSLAIPRRIVVSANLDPREMGNGDFFDSDGGIEDEDEEETESKIKSFIRFLQSVAPAVVEKVLVAAALFVLISLHQVLPAFRSSIFAAIMNVRIAWGSFGGLLILAVISIHQSRLQVFCTRTSIILAAILIVRIVLAAVSKFLSSGDDGRRSSGTGMRTA